MNVNAAKNRLHVSCTAYVLWRTPAVLVYMRGTCVVPVVGSATRQVQKAQTTLDWEINYST